MEAILAVTNTAEVEGKIRPEKIQTRTEFESMTSTLPVQRSTNWATKPTDSLLLCWLQINSRSWLVGKLVERWLVS